MKEILLLIILLTVGKFTIAQTVKEENFINPTGTYSYNGKTIKKNGETYGKFGTIKVKLLKDSKIAISLYVCKGAQSYNSGSFVDTLLYKNNTALYATFENDSTCKIVFTFKLKSLKVAQTQANLNNGCGFGHGVFADGNYRKISFRTPIISDPLEDL